jgi:hypothetical protein
MKIAIVGAGAIGGYLGARLAIAGEDVTFIARNRNLEAINANGFRLLLEDGSEQHAPTARAVQDMAEAGPQDAVLLTVKAHQVRDLLPGLRSLFGPETMVVTKINGVPVARVDGQQGLAILAIHEYIVQGNNEIEMIVNPAAPGSAPARQLRHGDGPASASLKLLLPRVGRPADPATARMLAQLDWAVACGDLHEAPLSVRQAVELPIAVHMNHAPIAMPTSLGAASLVTMERPIGDRHSSPTVTMP